MFSTCIYSPGAGADNPLWTKFWCQQKGPVTLPIWCKFKKISEVWCFTYFCRALPRGRFGRNNRTRGRQFTLNWAQGEVGVSLFSCRIFIKLFHKQAVMAVLHHCSLLIFQFNVNSMHNSYFSLKFNEKCRNHALSLLPSWLSLLPIWSGGRSHFSLLPGPSLTPDFCLFLYMYIAPGQVQTTPWGQNFYFNINLLSLWSFAVNFFH